MAGSNATREVDWDFLDEKPETKDTEKGLPGRKECMDAMCSQCMGYYYDGRDDCENLKCPLYSYMKYRQRDPNLNWRTEGYHLRRNRRKLRFEVETANRKREKAGKKTTKKKKASKRGTRRKK